VAVDENFLSILFSFRQTFQNPIHILIDAPSSTVVCWLDVVLAKLGLLVSNVAGGFSPSLQAPFVEYMRLHREEDAVRAAAQLPGICFSMLSLSLDSYVCHQRNGNPWSTQLPQTTHLLPRNALPYVYYLLRT
jgi:hypothetical protein